MNLRIRLLSWSVVLFVAAFSLNAEARLPGCRGSQPKTYLPEMNSQVLYWKTHTPDQFHERAHIAGIVKRITLMRDSHAQFEVQIGRDPRFSIEVIYNQSFGHLPAIQPGMHVEACGDYITTKTSPMGAILHWVHINPGDRDGGRHSDGYVSIDQVTYGNTYNGRTIGWHDPIEAQ